MSLSPAMFSSAEEEATGSGINWYGLLAVLIFYAAILAIGIYASWKSKSFKKGTKSEDVLLAGRDIGLVVGIFTLTGLCVVSLRYPIVRDWVRFYLYARWTIKTCLFQYLGS